MRRIVSFAILSLICACAYAQHDLGTYNDPFYNPAFIIGNNQLNLRGTHRWVGPGGYENGMHSLASASFEFDSHGIGIGVTYSNFQHRADHFNHARFNFAYRARIGDHSIVPALFLGATILDQSVSRKSGSAPLVGDNSLTTSVFDAGVGLGYMFRKLRVGLSGLNLNGGDHEYGVTEYGQRPVARVVPTIHFMAEYDFHLGSHFRVRPVTVFQYFFFEGTNSLAAQHLTIGIADISDLSARVNVSVGYGMAIPRHYDDYGSVLFLSPEIELPWFTVNYSLTLPLNRERTDRWSIPLPDLQNIHQLSLRIHLIRAEGKQDVFYFE